MPLTVDEVENKILSGEDGTTEFKRVEIEGQNVTHPHNESLAGEMVAFANAGGGWVLLGVTDDQLVEGIPEDKLDAVESWVLNVARDRCDPPIQPVIERFLVPDEDGVDQRILSVHVPESLYVHRTSDGNWYLRVGQHKEQMTHGELTKLFQERRHDYAFDESPVPEATREDLDEDLLREHLGQPEQISLERLLENKKILTEDTEGVLRPTVAGVLCFAQDPASFLSGAFIEAAVYKGAVRDSDDLVDTQTIQGPVNEQIDDALGFVDRHMQRPARKDPGREDYPQFPLTAVREAIVNAVAHRDYSVSGSKIRVFLYDDRLEVISPGRLPNTMDIEQLPHRQVTRNELLVSFLSRMTDREGRYYIEARGEGVGLILRRCEEVTGRRPAYEVHGDELQLTMWAAPSPHEDENDERG